VRAGYEVIVICRIPNGHPRSVRTINKVKYVCVPRPRYAKWDHIQTLKLFSEAWRVKATIFICFEIRTLLMGLILKAVKRIKVIYDCHEYKAEVYGGLLPIPLRETTTLLIYRAEKTFSKLCDCIWCVNNHISLRLRSRGMHPIVLPNFPRKELFANIQKLPENVSLKYKNRMVLIYVGGITEARGITSCLYVMARLKRMVPKAFLLCFGPFKSSYKNKLDKIIREQSLENYVEIIGHIRHDKIPSYLQLADLGIFLLQPVNRRYDWGEPIKYFEYSAAGLPVVISDFPSKRALIMKYGNGILVNPLDQEDIVNKIANLLKNHSLRKKMAARGRKAFATELNWNEIESKMLNSVRSLSC
jgi:glycosyltransferase involved in cell wall biosynthesis